MPEKFNDVYFWNNTQQLLNLMRFLDSHLHVDFQVLCHLDCEVIRKALRIQEECTVAQDNSLGLYILSYGGTKRYTSIPLYKLSIFAAAVYYASGMNEKEGRTDPINEMTLERGVELINKLYDCQATVTSNVVRSFVSVCRRSKDELGLIIAYKTAKFPEGLPDQVLEGAAEALRTFLYSSYIISQL